MLAFNNFISSYDQDCEDGTESHDIHISNNYDGDDYHCHHRYHHHHHHHHGLL
jgi:hypothetical protein